MKMKYLISVLTLVVLLPGLANAQTERKYIRQGNRKYNEFAADSIKKDSSLLVDAEASYRKALDVDPNNWDASYNLANSLFSQGKFEEASRQYQALAAKSDVDKAKRAAAYHNLGNCLLQGNNLQGAIEAYKDALRSNPADFETKYNLAWAQDKLKQQQNQQQQNQDQNKQDQEQNQDQQQQDQQQNQDQEQNQEQQDQNQQQDQQQEQQKQDQQQEQQQEQSDEQMSKEDAMRILEALENDEKDVQDKVQKQKAQPQKRRTQKDW